MIAVAAESTTAVERYTKLHPMPFPIVSDADHAVFDAYDVGSRAMSLGQRHAIGALNDGG